MKIDVLSVIPLITVLAVTLDAASVQACSSPLILDLNGDGIHTTSLRWPVEFDIDSDGEKEITGWTWPGSEDGFLWLDLNRNSKVDSGLELFGDFTLMPRGDFAEHGFEALAVYDRWDQGGNEDGFISSEDLIWSNLSLWVDRNHNGVSESDEIFALGSYDVHALDLKYSDILAHDNALNLHRYQSDYVQLVHPLLDIRPVDEQEAPLQRRRDLHDVIFQTRDQAEEN